MLVSYKELKRGYILKDCDALNIYGYKFVVCAASPGYYLKDSRGVQYNDWLFLHVYGMSDEQKDAWAARYGGKPGCLFPVMPTLPLLTEFVKNIYETCPFKIGDTVRIKERVYPEDDYPLCFVDQMAEQAGKTFTIKDIKPIAHTNPFDYRDEGGGDIYYYVLDGTPYHWTSNMFELVKRASPKKKLGFINGIAAAMQGTPAMRMMPARSHSSHLLFSGALGEQETTPVSELKKDKIPEGEDITVRPPKHYSTTFKI